MSDEPAGPSSLGPGCHAAPSLRFAIGCVLLLTLVACTPGVGPSRGGPAAPAAPIAPTIGAADVGIKKTIVIGITSPIKSFEPTRTGAAGGTFTLFDLFNNPLFEPDAHGAPQPRLLTKVPSLDDGTIKLLDDGRMQTTWDLRPDVTWQDGAPFTSADLAFTLRVYQDRGVGLQGSAPVSYMQSIATPDPRTAIVTWTAPFYKADQLGLREFWPFPQHLLGDALEADKAAFGNLPYWTNGFVGTGPYRLIDYGLGENLVLNRVDDYFLGRPPISTIEIHDVPDTNALFASFLSGAVDMVSEGALPQDLMLRLRAQWSASGEGSVVTGPGSLRSYILQLNPQYSDPPEIASDVRIRQGLFTAIDRVTLREAIMPGVPNTSADSLIPESDPRIAIVGKPFAVYAFDPTRAAQLLADAGWHRSGGGPLLNQAGAPVRLEVRSQAAQAKERSIAAQNWRDLGIDVTENELSATLSTDPQTSATFPGLDYRASANLETVLGRLQSSVIPTPEKRWVGDNTGAYRSPALDRLTQSMYGSVDPQAQVRMLKQIGETLAADLPTIPTHFTISMAGVRSGVHALTDNYVGTSVFGGMSRNAHLWNRD
jgi:peptide/nickel transport system substrate-binding protein